MAKKCYSLTKAPKQDQNGHSNQTSVYKSDNVTSADTSYGPRVPNNGHVMEMEKRRDESHRNGDNNATDLEGIPEEDSENRGAWGTKLEFLLSCMSMSVGLGNVWRFPNVAYNNGGGAFLIPYLIVLVIIGRPLYYMELVMGQFSGCGPIKVWRVIPGLKGS